MADSSVQQRFCTKCGTQVRPGASFCVSCGESLFTPPQSAGHTPESSSNAAGEADAAQNPDEVTEAVCALAFAESWEECKRVVEDYRSVLLTEDADEELAALLTSNRDDEDTVRALKQNRDLLARCRREGIDAAFAEYLQPPAAMHSEPLADAEWNQTLDAVAEFVNARLWVASKLVLKQHRDLLLTDTADEVLSAFIAQRRRDGDEDVRDLEEHRALLARCRQNGIDAAFAEHSQKKQPFLEWAREWLIVIAVFILIFVVIGLFT